MRRVGEWGVGKFGDGVGGTEGRLKMGCRDVWCRLA